MAFNKKVTAHVLTWLMVLAPFALIVPSAAAHTNVVSSGTFRLDADLSLDPDDDRWLTSPPEWGALEANLEVRRMLAAEWLDADAAEPVCHVDDTTCRGANDGAFIVDDPDVPGQFGGNLNDGTNDPNGVDNIAGNADDNFELDGDEELLGWDEDAFTGVNVRLCSPSQIGTASTGFGPEDLLPEDDVESSGDGYESIDIYDPADTDLDEDKTAGFFVDANDDTPAAVWADGELPPFTDDPREAFFAALDTTDDGKITRTELDAAYELDEVAAGNFELGALIVPGFTTTFEDVDFNEVGEWQVIEGADCTVGAGEDVFTAFLLLPANELSVTTTPGSITWSYEDDQEEPELVEVDLSATVQWGGHGMENARVWFWACNRALGDAPYCDDISAAEGLDDGEAADDRVDPAPTLIELTGKDGLAEYDSDNLYPGAGRYLILATCILQNEDGDEYLEDPEDVADDADPDHECADAITANADLDAANAFAAGEIDPQVWGNTTFEIRAGTLEVEQVKGGNVTENRLTEVVWQLTYADTTVLALADNTHGINDDSVWANDHANWTLDVTMPNGKHVLLSYDLDDENGDGVLGDEVEDANTDGATLGDGVLECEAVAAGDCDVGTWVLVDADDVTDCDRWADDNYDCPTYAGGVVDDEGDVDIITLPEETEDIGTGLDPEVIRDGISVRLNPEIDTDEPNEPGFNEIDNPDENDDDEDRWLGYLSAFLPWSSGTYTFEMRMNHYGDHNAEWIGRWTLSVESAPEFGFADVQPTEMEVPTRVDNSGVAAAGYKVDPWIPDPHEDLDAGVYNEEVDGNDAEADPAFGYVLAFRLVDEEGDDVNGFPCQGSDQDGETIEVDDDNTDDSTGDDIVFFPPDEDERDCPDFEGADDIKVDGDLLYAIENDWIIEAVYENPADTLPGALANTPDPLEVCLDTTRFNRQVIDPDADDSEDYQPNVEIDIGGHLGGDRYAPGGNDDAYLIPVYCVFNVVPASSAPVRVIATIDGQEYVQEFTVTEGGFARVTEVTATAETDGIVRVSLTDEDGQAIGGSAQLFIRGEFPADAEAGDPVEDEDGEAIAGSCTGGVCTFTLNEEDEVDANRLAVYALWAAGDGTLNYAYAPVNLEPTSDLNTSVSPTRVTAGVPTDFTVNVTGGDDAWEVFFLTHYEWLQVQQRGVLYVDDEDFREDSADFAPGGDMFDFEFSGDMSDVQEMELKAEGPYHVYVRNQDVTRDNNGSMPTIEVVPPVVTFSPERVAFAIASEVTVTVSVVDMNGDPLSGDLRVAYDPDEDFFVSGDYGFAGIEGSDVDDSTDVDQHEEWGRLADADTAENFEDDYPYTYLGYTDDDALAPQSTLVNDLTVINVDDGEAQIRVTGDDIGPINWTFNHEDGDLWVNTTGALEIVSPQISVNPDRLIAGEGTDVTVTVLDLEGNPVENLFLALCGNPLATATSCTGVVSTGANGQATVSVFPTGTGTLEVWVHEDVTGEEEGSCQVSPEDLGRVNPTSGLALTAADADALDDDCDQAGAIGDDYVFEDTGIFLPVVAQQQLLRVTVPDTASVGAEMNIGVTAANQPIEGATVTVTGPDGAQVLSATTNANGQVAFTPAAVGTYQVRASAEGFQDGTGSFRAVEGPVEEVSTFAVSNFEASPTTVTVGEGLEASATVQNTGNSRGTATVVLLVNGAQRASQAVSLNPGESQTVAFDFTPSVAGTARLQVKAGDAMSEERTVTVQPRPGPGDDDQPTPEPGPVPGFEVVFALAALGAAVVAFRRRK